MFPDIGERIEQFVQEHKVGADAWRRTGVLTFDGNIKLKDKVTYEKIRHKFTYGTVVQLRMCLANQEKISQKVHGYH